MIRTLVLAFALTACGSSHEKPAAPPEQPKPQTTPEMAKFHDAFEPHWQAAKSEQRKQDTCAAVPELKADADAIATATPPIGANADTWTKSTRYLVGSLVALEAACQDSVPEKFEVALEGVQHSYDLLSDAAGPTKM